MKIKVERCTKSFRLTFPRGEQESISNPDNDWWNRKAATQALNIAENVYGMKRAHIRFDVVNSYIEYNSIPDYETGGTDERGYPVCAPGTTWFNPNPPPAIGARVKANFNKLGEATVTGYFTEGKYLGLLVKFDNPPAWYVKQNKGNQTGHLFGPEFELIG